MTEPSSASSFSRRTSLANTGRGLVAAALVGEISPATASAAEDDLPGKPVKLTPFRARTEQQTGPLPEPMPQEIGLGLPWWALGDLALNQIVPAFGSCKKARLAAW